MTRFMEIDPHELTDNVFRLIGQDWMLVTAGKREAFNTMTASWGGLGVLWNSPVSMIFVRPSRYTYEFIEREPGVYPVLFRTGGEAGTADLRLQVGPGYRQGQGNRTDSPVRPAGPLF